MKSREAILFLFLIFDLASSASAYVSTNNVYYSNYDTVDDHVYLNNVDYSNIIDVSSSGVSGSGTATNSESQPGNSTYIDAMQIPDKDMGSSIKIISNRLDCSKEISNSLQEMPSLSSDFSMGMGTARSRVWNEFSSAQLDLKTVGCEYSGSQFAGEDLISLHGTGSRTDSYDGASSLVQNLSLSHLSKSAGIDLAFRELNDTGKPLEFNWTNYAGSSGSGWARSVVQFDVNHGEKYADFSMVGKSKVPAHFAKQIPSTGPSTQISDAWWIKYLIFPQEVKLES